ncbi:MAG TPA: efflux RND transporter periplasmic adaptor subunit [Kofleriaceae bacterium]|nr:efflux RND transporter periplasmic adaptor subunit [Kofleriaceae bacterium]
MTNTSLLLLVLSGAATACSVPDAPAGTAAPVHKIAVRVAPVVRGPVVRPVHAAGRLGYSAETRLAFKVGGVVARVAVDAGDRVRKGQVLARLDPREIDAQVSGAESGRVKAERDLERARLLARDRVVPEEVVQNAATAAEVARATASAARFNRRFAEIVAPADGVVLARLVEQGEVVGPGAPVLVLGAAGAGRVVRAGVADRDVVRLAAGDVAEVTLDALPGRRLSGTVAEIAPAATTGTGLFEIEVRIDDAGVAPAPLAAGMIARVAVSPRAAETMTTVPIAALVDADGTRGLVYALGADRASVEPRPVDIAFLAGEHVALRGGLDGVAEVVTDGSAYLDAQSAVAVTP